MNWAKIMPADGACRSPSAEEETAQGIRLPIIPSLLATSVRLVNTSIRHMASRRLQPGQGPVAGRGPASAPHRAALCGWWGSGASKTGLWDTVAERQPRILVVDEVDKMAADMGALLSLMEGGRLVRAKVGRRLDYQVELWVVAATNSLTHTAPELISRFAVRRLHVYTRTRVPGGRHGRAGAPGGPGATPGGGDRSRG